jgi:hypothetical protein
MTNPAQMKAHAKRIAGRQQQEESSMTIELPRQSVNHEAVQMLEQILASLKAGRLGAVAVIGVSPTGEVFTSSIGAQPAQVYIGCDILKRQLLEAMMGNKGIGRPVVRAGGALS